MGYSKEFDATKITVPKFLLLGDWEDVSWHNEVCPRFNSERFGLAVWVDYDDPAERELNCIDQPGEWKKYTVVQLLDEGELSDDTLFSTEDTDLLEIWLTNYIIEKGL